MTPFTYERSTDGCDETFAVLYPDGSHLVSIPFWEEVGRAESEATMIVKALNAFHGANPSTKA
ncbi:hypothetical protein [Zavarzinella formosa]|uniref:hypothetical protein n=1 Tax=Zavarzinella formosa TaxID=360055 RepID=UPI00030EE87F|nr:hypothetical protein [Zavarzinella formosa]